MFERGDGRIFNPRRVNEAMDRVLAEMPDLPHLTPHGLRHLHASALLKGGRPVHYVQRRLGHTSAGTTLGFYAHLIPDTDTADAAAFAHFIGQDEATSARDSA